MGRASNGDKKKREWCKQRWLTTRPGKKTTSIEEDAIKKVAKERVEHETTAKKKGQGTIPYPRIFRLTLNESFDTSNIEIVHIDSRLRLSAMHYIELGCRAISITNHDVIHTIPPRS